MVRPNDKQIRNRDRKVNGKFGKAKQRPISKNQRPVSNGRKPTSHKPIAKTQNQFAKNQKRDGSGNKKKRVKFSEEPTLLESDDDKVSDDDGADQVSDASDAGDASDAEEAGAPKSADKSKHLKESRKEKREKTKFDFERNSRTIFVGNLPSDLDHRGVEKLFKCCGPVESARVRSIVPEKEKLSPKVALITKRIHPKVDSINAYVVFKTNEEDKCVKEALKMNGKLIDGHHIRVDRAQRPRSKKQTLTSRKKSIFIGNLRFDTRDDDLINHFNKVGPVDHVRLVRDRATGLGKGFGFVCFQDRASATAALKLNDTKFKGRELRIKKIDK